MKILMTSMHKGALAMTKDKKGTPAECINVLEVYRIAQLLRREGHEVTIATTKDTDIATAYENLDVNSYDRVMIMNSSVDFPRWRRKQTC